MSFFFQLRVEEATRERLNPPVFHSRPASSMGFKLCRSAFHNQTQNHLALERQNFM